MAGSVLVHAATAASSNVEPPLAMEASILPAFPVDDPVSAASPAGQFTPAIASDGTNFLAVWHDNRTSVESDIYGARFTTNGVLLDPSGFVISAATGIQSAPALAWNGTNYFVAWQDRRNGNLDIFGTRIGPDGVVQETNGLAIVTAANDQRLPAVASVDGDFLVVWQDGRKGSGDNDIFGARVTGTGGLIETNGFAISSAISNQGSPSVAANDTGYLVAWHDLRSGGSLDVYAARVTSAGVVDDPAGLPLATGSAPESGPGVAGNGAEWLVAWQDFRNGSDYDVYATRVTAAGAVVSPGGLAINTESGGQENPVVGADGTDWFVAWQDRRGGASYDVYATPVVAGTGLPVSPAANVVSTADNDQRFPAVAFGNGVYATVWEDVRSGTNTDIFAAGITPAGATVNSDGWIISTVANAQESPAIASNGTHHLVVWRDFRNDADGDIYGARFTEDGEALDPVAIPISTVDGFQGAPRVASNGVDWLVVWQDFRNNSHDDIFAARVLADGNVPEPNGIPLSTSAGVQRAPDVAGNAGGFLVVWQDRRSNVSDDIYAARVASTGDVVDAAGILVANPSGDQLAPTVTAVGDDFLVAWQDRRNAADPDIFGTRVLADGTVENVDGIGLIVGPGVQAAPRLASDAGALLMAWEDDRDGGELHVYGARLSSSGNVLDESPLRLSDVNSLQRKPVIAAGGGDFLIAWEDARNEGRTNIFATRVTESGAVLDPEGTALVAVEQSQFSPGVARLGGSYLAVYRGLDRGNVNRIFGARLPPALTPAISFAPGDLDYPAETGRQLIDAAITLSDAQAADFEGATLELELTQNGTSNDRLGILHEGSEPGRIGVVGNQVEYGGTLIGFFTGGGSVAQPLLIILNASATADAVLALARRLSFENVAADPVTVPRTLSLTLSTSAGGAGLPTTKTVNVIAAGSLPTIVTQPLTRTLSPGGELVLSVVVSGSPPFEYEWRRNGVKVDGETGPTLTIDAATFAAAGSYTVVVSNEFGSIESAAAIVSLLDLKLYPGLTLAGPVGTNYRIEWAPLVGNTNEFQVLTNLTLPSTPFLFFDPEPAENERRFYRAILVE